VKKSIFLALIIGLFIVQMGFSDVTPSSYEQGIKLYREGKYEVALVFFEKAFKENPLNSKLYFYLGNIYNHKKDFDKSIEAYKRGLDLASKEDRRSFLYNLARSYQASNRFKEALIVYNKLEKETDRYPEIYLYQGMVHFNLRNKADVIKSWETYLVKAPENSQYNSVRKAIDYLKDKNFKWPERPVDNKDMRVIYLTSGTGTVGTAGDGSKTGVAKAGRDEDKRILEEKGKDKSAKSTDKDTKDAEDKLVKELQQKEEDKANKEIDDSVVNLKVDSEDLKVKDQKKKEGKEFDDIER